MVFPLFGVSCCFVVILRWVVVVCLIWLAWAFVLLTGLFGYFIGWLDMFVLVCVLLNVVNVFVTCLIAK